VTADKTLVACRFARSLATYDGAAFVQREMAGQLVDRLLEAAGTDRFEDVLELGCGTGLLTEQMVSRCRVRRLVLNDLVDECEATARRVRERGCGVEVEFLPGDMEALAVPGLYDLVISNAALQWAGDLAGMLERIAGWLRPGGIVAAAAFGPANFVEISQLTGLSLRYEGAAEWCEMLGRDYDLLHVGEEVRTLWFLSARDILRHLKQTGVNALDPRSWTPGEIRCFCRDYEEQFALDRRVPLTYHPLVVIARRCAERKVQR
jgi:malonyl-CoA O-methyltransferase